MPRGVLPAYMLQGHLRWPESTAANRLQTGVVEPKPSKVGVRRSPGPSPWPKPLKVGSSSAYKGVLSPQAWGNGRLREGGGDRWASPPAGVWGNGSQDGCWARGRRRGAGWDVAEAAGPGRPGRRRWNAVCSIGGSGTGAHAALTALTAMVGLFQSHLLDWTAICVHQRRTHGKDRRAERNLP